MYGNVRVKQWLIRELPQKRRRTEVSALSNWQHWCRRQAQSYSDDNRVRFSGATSIRIPRVCARLESSGNQKEHTINRFSILTISAITALGLIQFRKSIAMKRFCMLLVLAGSFAGFAFAAKSAEVKVLSSNAFRAVMLEVTPRFESTTGHKVIVRFMGTNLKPTIEAGEQFDVAITQSDIIESLIKQNKIAAGTDVAIAYTGLGAGIRAGAPKPDIGSVKSFKKTVLNAKAVAYSGEGRAGIVVAEIFSRLGIADQMKAKSVLFTGAGGPKTVIDGQADLVIQTFGGLVGVPGLDYIGPLPPDLQMYTVLTGGISSSSSQPQAAKSFVEFLQSQEAVAAIRARGMEPRAPRL